MNRQKRKQDLRLRPFLDKLETRRLMSVSAADERTGHPLARAAAELESEIGGGDLGGFAQELAQRPRLAADLGLGALSRVLRRHAGYAERHGWAASLESELRAHPNYAATHHLTAALGDPKTPAVGTVTPPVRTIATKTEPASQTIARKTTPVLQNVAVVTSDLTALQQLEDTFAKAAASQPASPTIVAPTPTAPISPAAPSVVATDPLSVAVGGALDVTLPNLGLGTSGLTFTITPQPLPSNISFNRDTGELIFMPAPGQQGDFNFSVAVSNGSQNGLITVPITVTAPALASTEVSGQVVDENGNPLPDMPVTIGGISTTTDSSGYFTLTGVPANPGTISAGGSVGTDEGRLDLTAPIAQLLGHDIYADANNVVSSPLILPMINWSTPASFGQTQSASLSQTSSATAVNITTPAAPGFSIQMPVSPTAISPAAGSVQVAELPAALSAQHMAPGMSSNLFLFNIVGTGLSSSVQVTLPNTAGFQPGAVVFLTQFNSITGGHDVVGQLVVSDDGETMTSTSPITLSATAATVAGASPAFEPADDGPVVTTYTGCWGDAMEEDTPTPTSNCDGCQPLAAAYGNSGSSSGSGSSASSSSSIGSSSFFGSSSSSGSSGIFGPMSASAGGSGGIYVASGVMDSDAGLVTGEYFLNNQLATYQAQGQTLGINLQYSSAQADPTPVVEYQFTTPIGGESSSISSITAQVSLGGVVQGDPVTYETPDGLTDGETYDIPMQVDASELPTGVYTYAITVTKVYGTETFTDVTSTVEGSVNVVNESDDPLGAGWSIGGLQQLSQLATNGPVLITAGQQGTEAFQPAYADGQTYVQDLAISTTSSSSQILANDGTGSFSAPTVSASDTVVGSASGIFTSDGEQDLAVVTSSTLQIELNNGSGGFTAGDSYAIPSGYEAKGVVVGNFSGHDNSDLDIAVLLASTSSELYSVAVYIGDGDGTFGTPVISAAGGGDGGEGQATGAQADSIVAGDFNNDGETDLAFVADGDSSGALVELMLATSGGSMSYDSNVTVPSHNVAVNVATLDYNGDGDTDLVVEAANTSLTESLSNLILYAGDGSGGFTETAEYQTVGSADPFVTGLVTGDFQGPSMGLEIAVPEVGGAKAIDIVPVSSSGEMGPAVLYPVNSVYGGGVRGNIVAADFNGSGRPSIAITEGSDNIWLLLSDPSSNQFLPVEDITTTSPPGLLAAAPFMGTPATLVYRGPTSDPSTLVQNDDGSWTRTYPDGTVIQFNAAGQETSESDRNDNTYTYTYVTSGPAAGALASITDPVGLTTTLVYDEYGYISTITNPDGFVTNFTVDGYGNLTEVEDPLGDTWEYGYTTPSNHEATGETDPNGNTATATYNSLGQLTSETLYDGTSTTSIDSAQSNGLLAPGDSGSLSTNYDASVTEPDGQTTTLSFNWMSHPTGEVAPNDGLTTITYNEYGFPTTETDALGRTVTYTYDSAGDVTSITEPYTAFIDFHYYSSATETISYDQYG